MIELSNISYKYRRKERFALSDVSLSVRPGVLFTLLGPNGAGKTTIMRIIAGLIVATRGKVRISGFDVLRDEQRARQSLGLVLGDDRTFYFRLSGAQNLEFFGGLYGVGRTTLRKRIPEVLEMVGLEDHAGLQYMRYSTGMKKRLSMARALLHKPMVLLLDEPNSGVDPQSARHIREIILALKEENRTILLATQNMDEAEKISDTIGFLKDGTLSKVGRIADYKNLVAGKTLEIEFDRIPANMLASARRNLIRDIEANTSCESAQWEDHKLQIRYNGSFDMTRVFGMIVQEGFRVQGTRTLEASLEDVFIRLAE